MCLFDGGLWNYFLYDSHGTSFVAYTIAYTIVSVLSERSHRFILEPSVFFSLDTISNHANMGKLLVKLNLYNIP